MKILILSNSCFNTNLYSIQMTSLIEDFVNKKKYDISVINPDLPLITKFQGKNWFFKIAKIYKINKFPKLSWNNVARLYMTL